MTISEAIDRADALRPGNPIDPETKQRWLRETDGQLRAQVVSRCDTRAFDGVGADTAPWDYGLEEDVLLLVPPPYDALYPHGLCAQIDLALGETDRYMNEAEQYNGLVTEWAAFVRRRFRPAAAPRLRW